MCKYYAILYKGFEHTEDFGIQEHPGTNPLHLLRDESLYKVTDKQASLLLRQPGTVTPDTLPVFLFFQGSSS